MAIGQNSSAQSLTDIEKEFKKMHDAIEADILTSAASEMHKFLKEFVRYAHVSPEGAIEFAQANLRDNGGAFQVNTSKDKNLTIISFYNFDSILSSLYEHIYLYQVNGQWQIVDETSQTPQMEKSSN